MTDVQNSEGYKKAKELANKLKAEKEAKDQEKEKLMTNIKKELQVANDQLAVAEMSPDLADFYKSNATVGTDNLSVSLPILKVTESNSMNELANGKDAELGGLYYAPEKESYKELEVSVMTISRGFYAMTNDKEPRPKFNQLMGGVILETMQPFVMFFSGTRLENLWNFGKEIKPFTKHKVSPVPMMAFRVRLSTEAVKTEFGKNHVVRFDLVRNEKGQIETITDMKKLRMIQNGVAVLEDMFTGFIDQKEVNKLTGELLSEKREVVDDPQQDVEDENKIPF